MSELFIKSEVKKMLNNSSLEVHPKMVCSIVKLFKIKYGNVNQKHIASIATKLINEY